MSIQLIQKYYAEIDKIIPYGGSRNESSLETMKIVKEMPS
jgi:hypothetical protein